LKDGNLKWPFETDDKIGYSPSVADDVVYLGSDDSYLYALQNIGRQPDLELQNQPS